MRDRLIYIHYMYIYYIYTCIYILCIYNVCTYNICYKPHSQIHTVQRGKSMSSSCRNDLCSYSLVFQSVTIDVK